MLLPELSWEVLQRFKMMPQGVGVFSRIEEFHDRGVLPVVFVVELMNLLQMFLTDRGALSIWSWEFRRTSSPKPPIYSDSL